MALFSCSLLVSDLEVDEAALFYLGVLGPEMKPTSVIIVTL